MRSMFYSQLFELRLYYQNQLSSKVGILQTIHINVTSAICLRVDGRIITNCSLDTQYTPITVLWNLILSNIFTTIPSDYLAHLVFNFAEKAKNSGRKN